MANKEIPYKIYLNESEMPKYWYNLRADMKNKPAPLLNPGTGKPMTAAELGGVFCEDLVNWTTTHGNTRCPRKSWISTRCIVLRPWSGPTAWKRS